MASILRRRRDHAKVVLDESLKCFTDQNDAWGVALATTYLGIASAFEPGFEDEARPLMLEGQARFRAMGDDWGLSTASHYLGSIAMRRGDFAAARELTLEMLGVAREVSDNYRVARNLHQLAEIALAEGDIGKATEHLSCSLKLNFEQGRTGDGAQQLRLMARLDALTNRPERVARLLAAASRLAASERTLPPDDPAVNESVLEGAKESLGKQKFESEWARGLAMSFDQAVAFAAAPHSAP